MPKVSIQIVTWNSLKFLPDCLESIFQQTYKDFSVLVIDNVSNDGTIEFLRDKYPQVFVVRNTRNLGFCGGHNQGFKLIQEPPYILVLNPDVILGSDFLEKLVAVVEKNPKIGAVGGKLLRIQIGDPEIDEKIKTKFIDSVGLEIKKSRQVVNRGEGELDQGQYDKSEIVFGISGGCVLYRRAALEDIKIPIIDSQSVNWHKIRRLASSWEYLDQDFFAYKEDIDLAWRLKRRGWQSFYLSNAIAYHFRQAKSLKGVRQKFSGRQQKSSWVNYLSYRNHFFLLIKNERFKDFFRYLPYIFWYELKKFIYILLLEQSTLKALIDVLRKMPKMLKKRKIIMTR